MGHCLAFDLTLLIQILTPLPLFLFPSVSPAGKTSTCLSSPEESFHKPVKLTGMKSYDRTDTECEQELRQTLLPNGHALRASDSESAPLRRASD